VTLTLFNSGGAPGGLRKVRGHPTGYYFLPSFNPYIRCQVGTLEFFAPEGRNRVFDKPRSRLTLFSNINGFFRCGEHSVAAPSGSLCYRVHSQRRHQPIVDALEYTVEVFGPLRHAGSIISGARGL